MQMRPGSDSYTNIQGTSFQRAEVAWYWRTFSVAASWLLLGGFLSLLWQFDGSMPEIRVSRVFIGVFSIALLVAGYSLTLLLGVAVRDYHFRAESVFTPAFSSCMFSLITIFFAFIISERFNWNTEAALTAAFSAFSSLVYGALIIWAYRKVWKSKQPINDELQIPLTQGHSQSPSIVATQQSSGYHDNYIANMYPTARGRSPSDVPSARASESSFRRLSDQAEPQPERALTEDELTRQQLLMLLLRGPDRSSSQSSRENRSYHIDWAGSGSAEDPLRAAPRRDDQEQQQSYTAYPGAQGLSPPQQQQPYDSLLGANSLLSPQNLPIKTSAQLSAIPPSERAWDGRMRSVSDLPQGMLHPALRDPVFVSPTASREQRRMEIERGTR